VNKKPPPILPKGRRRESFREEIVKVKKTYA